ncbi:serine/threonine protein kinase [Methylobacterium platani]|nr:serine/threonine-protein kinase [Methylobacterium platani]
MDDRFAHGGMSRASVFNDTHLDRNVVIKALLPGRDHRRLLDEIRALQSIRSRHVVQIYDIYNDENGVIQGLVEELVSGPQFAEGEVPKDAASFMKLIYPLAKGIYDIHSSGIIHRDIKPSNIKFDGEGCLKIFDFGLARDEEADAYTKGAVGTLGYMAPELFYDHAGGNVYFSTAVDTYAFGVTAYYTYSRSVPKPMRQLPPVLPCEEADFSKSHLNLPEDISNILNRCLSERPSDRPEMRDVCTILEKYILHGQHRALITYGSTNYYLSAASKSVRLAVQDKGQVNITYNDLEFVIGNVSGDVVVNNIPAKNGDILPGSCVVALGDPTKPSARVFITIDVSHPEVTL